MADGEAHAGPVRVFKDLDRVDDEFLRQLATRVHLMDLAYAFGFGVPELLSRLETVIRPGMVEQLRSAIAMAKSSQERYPVDESVRSARTRVVDVARRVLGPSS
ncbi:MAG: hypothetical protein ACKO2D_14010 [Chloroflexota bacterium]|jgi:hypothetical protein|nr:hypothetical protein [Chloroflexota bacterium]NCA13486.1 hypothetical protein [Pseudomonadota bacterium]